MLNPTNLRFPPDMEREDNKRQLKGYLIGMGSSLAIVSLHSYIIAMETYNTTNSVAQAVYSGLGVAIMESQFAGLVGAVLGDLISKDKKTPQEALVAETQTSGTQFIQIPL